MNHTVLFSKQLLSDFIMLRCHVDERTEGGSEREKRKVVRVCESASVCMCVFHVRVFCANKELGISSDSQKSKKNK